MTAGAVGVEPRDGVAAASRQPDPLDELRQLRDVRLVQPRFTGSYRGRVGEELPC